MKEGSRRSGGVYNEHVMFHIISLLFWHKTLS